MKRNIVLFGAAVLFTTWILAEIIEREQKKEIKDTYSIEEILILLPY